jgi:hypothetical protein
LFGDYADDLTKKMGKLSGGLPVVVVQFAKVKIFRGNINFDVKCIMFVHNERMKEYNVGCT